MLLGLYHVYHLVDNNGRPLHYKTLVPGISTVVLRGGTAVAPPTVPGVTELEMQSIPNFCIAEGSKHQVVTVQLACTYIRHCAQQVGAGGG